MGARRITSVACHVSQFMCPPLPVSLSPSDLFLLLCIDGRAPLVSVRSMVGSRRSTFRELGPGTRVIQSHVRLMPALVLCEVAVYGKDRRCAEPVLRTDASHYPIAFVSFDLEQAGTVSNYRNQYLCKLLLFTICLFFGTCITWCWLL